MEKKEVSIKIDKETKAKIDKYKKETGIPIKYIIRNAIEKYIKKETKQKK